MQEFLDITLAVKLPHNRHQTDNESLREQHNQKRKQSHITDPQFDKSVYQQNYKVYLQAERYINRHTARDSAAREINTIVTTHDNSSSCQMSRGQSNLEGCIKPPLAVGNQDPYLTQCSLGPQMGC